MFKLKKLTAMIAAALTMTVTNTACTDEKAVPLNVGELEITFFDVGKADSIVLRSENSTVVIDCGEKGDGKEVAAELEHAREVEKQMAREAREKLRAEKSEAFKETVARKREELKNWFSNPGKRE